MLFFSMRRPRAGGIPVAPQLSTPLHPTLRSCTPPDPTGRVPLRCHMAWTPPHRTYVFGIISRTPPHSTSGCLHGPICVRANMRVHPTAPHFCAIWHEDGTPATWPYMCSAQNGGPHRTPPHHGMLLRYLRTRHLAAILTHEVVGPHPTPAIWHTSCRRMARRRHMAPLDPTPPHRTPRQRGCHAAPTSLD